MTWSMSVDAPDGTVSISVRNPLFGERDSEPRRQFRGVTESGLVFVQDLGREDRFLECSWTFLTPVMRSDLLLFFGPSGTLRQARPFTLTITNTTFAVVIGTGMTINRLALGTGQGFGTGQSVVPATVVLEGVHLEQPEIAFAQHRAERYSTELTFRLS